MGSPQPAPASVWSSRARVVYDRVRRLEGAERRAALDLECGDDWALHAEIAALLAHEPSPGALLPPTGDGDPARPPPSEALAPDAIPGYRLGPVLGVGGAGVVYEAEQASPRRLVALKVFRSPRPDPHFRRRIAHEAEILARLRHPSIAQVYAAHAGSDGGTDVPWIAMERVEGVPIDVWCRERQTPLRARVELLAAVAEAIAHAHASGVVHRDLKPTNVLVTADGLPKVVDFGVARSFHDAPAVGTLHTRDGDLIGTLAYMAPEQVEGASSLVDTRTDVHALGTLAFETIAGRRPRDPDWMTLPEWASVLKTPPPSLVEVVPETPADLAWVVGKALTPEREGRYATAAAFADDLRRFLRHEPVLARAPTKGYLVRSFVRRHRALVAGVAATVVALAAGLAASVAFAVDANEQRLRADAESGDARREAYRAQLSVAAEAIRSGYAFGARAALDRTSAELRGWEWRHLDARIDRTSRRADWAEPVAAWIALSADGRRLAGVRSDGGVRIFDTESGAVLCAVAPGARVQHATFLADGGRLVLVREGGATDVVDVRTDAVRTLPPLPGRTGGCDALAASTRGALVVESRTTATPRLRFYDLDDGRTWTRDVADTWYWSAICFDESDRRIAIAPGDGRVEILDVEGDAPARLVGRHAAHVGELVWAPGSRRLVSVSSDRSALLLAPEDVERRQVVSLHQQRAIAAAASPDGRFFATWSGERVVRLFRASDLVLLAELPAIDAEEHAGLRFSADGGELSLLDAKGRRTWATAGDSDLDVLRGHATSADGNPFPYVYGVAFSPDGRRLATGGWDGTVRVVAVATGRTLAVLAAPGPIHSLGWSPDGGTIVAASRPGHVVAFDAWTGETLATEPTGSDAMTGGVEWSRDGVDLLTAVARSGVVRRDPRTLLPRGGALGGWVDAWALATGAGGEIYVGEGDGRLRRLDEGAPAIPFEGHALAITGIARSPDGRLVATAGEDGEIRLHDTRTGALRHHSASHVGRVYAVAFSPDGRRLATGGDDGTIRLHDPARGEELLALRGHASYVYRIAFAPDGETIASASGDNTVRLWSTRPLRARVSRRDVELALEASVESRVRALLIRATTPREAIAAIRSDAGFDVPSREAALDVALRLLAPR